MVPCESTHIVESKSFKLYLGSFNGTRIADAAEVRRRIQVDVSTAVWQGGPVQASVGVRLIAPEDFDREAVHELDGLYLDRLDIECEPVPGPTPDLLTAAFDEQPVLGELQPGAREVQPLVQVNLQRGQDVFVRQEREGRGLDGVGANGGGVGLHRDSSRGGRFWPSRIVRPWRR